MAFVGIPHLFMRYGPRGETRDALLGPLVHRIQARFGQGAIPSGAHRGTPIGLWAGATVSVAWDSLCGRQRPSAFHDVQTGAPLMKTTVLSPAELTQLRAARSR